MSRVARRTLQQAYEDLDVARPVGALARMRRSANASARRLVPRAVRALFGESKTSSWVLVGLLFVFCLLLVRPVGMSLLSWHRTASVLSDRREEVSALQKRNVMLDRRLEYYRTDAFVAERARRYGLVQPGEAGFVVRELVHPESVGRYAGNRLRNALAGPNAAAPR